MNKLESIGDIEFVFGSLFSMSSKLQTLLDKELSVYDLTAAQWFLSIVLSSLFDEPPTLGEVAQEMESSHQNVKQVALKLQSKGFLEIKNDDRDKRAIRLALTQKSAEFWESTKQESSRMLSQVFDGLDAQQMAMLRKFISKIGDNIDHMNKKYE